MRTIMASRTPNDLSFSFSRRHFKWVLNKGGSHGGGAPDHHHSSDDNSEEEEDEEQQQQQVCNRKKRAKAAVSRLRTAFMAVVLRTTRTAAAAKLTGTLFGHRRGHVHFAFQLDPKSTPFVLLEFATPTATLVREMASGLVRIALECDKKAKGGGGGAPRLMEEKMWSTYCNGKRCGYAVRRDCGPAECKVLRAVEMVSTGAGVLPAAAEEEAEGEVMYMRASFERVVGSRDSEALYMVNPGVSSGGPELSIYFLRV